MDPQAMEEEDSHIERVREKRAPNALAEGGRDALSPWSQSKGKIGGGRGWKAKHLLMALYHTGRPGGKNGMVRNQDPVKVTG